MKKTKRTFVLELPDSVWKTLDKYGYNYERNFQEEAENVAYYIWVEENADEDDQDVGTATAKEVEAQNATCKTKR